MANNILPQLRSISHRASRLELNLTCPGSADLESRVPISPPGPPAIEGTKTHKVGEVALTKMIDPSELLGQTLVCRQTNENGEEYPIEFEVTGEQVENATVYTDYIYSLMAGKPKNRLWVEEDIGVYYSRDIDSPKVKIGAHADGIVLEPGEVLHIVDYKNGRIPVSVIGCVQLVQYAIGAISFLSLKLGSHKPGEGPPDWYPKSIRMTIVQPNAPVGYDIAHWDVHYLDQFFNEWVPKIKDAVFSAEKNAGVYEINPGCKWCDGLTACPAVIGETLMFAQRSLEGMYKVTPHQMSELLKKAPAIKALCKRLDDVAEKRFITQGPAAVPGYKRVIETRRYKAWKPGAEDGLRDIGFDETDLFGEPALRSPAQIEATRKSYKWQDAAKDVQKLIQLTPKDYTYIVPIDDPRPAADDATADFEGHYDTPKGGDSDGWDDLID